jgi:hypothetical protein
MSEVDFGDTVEKAKAAATEGAMKAEEGATIAWGDILGVGQKIAGAMRTLRGYGFDDLLARLGLYRSRGVAPMFGAFAAGITVGAGIGILVAPKSGAETRALIAKASKDLFTNTKEKFSATTSKVADAAKKLSDRTHVTPGDGTYRQSPLS